MTRAFFFVGGLVALVLIFVAQSVVVFSAPGSGASARAETARAVAPTALDATAVAIDDLAAWPTAAGH